MNAHPVPPYDPWLSLQAYHETWLAGLDRAGAGMSLRRARLQRLLASALRDSPLYAGRARGARALTDLAPISKAELMRHFDDWATDRRITRAAADAALQAPAGVADAWLGRYLLWTSSGTSGQPGIFVQDTSSLAAFDALDALRLRSSGALQPALPLWGLGRRFAYVGAIGGPYAGHVSMGRLQRLFAAPWVPRVDLLSVLDPLPQIARQLERLQPDVLVTYPSCATELAALQRRGAMALQLDEVWLGGEQLSAAQRSTLREVYRCTVRNAYGASEFYSMAFECAHGQLHLNDDWVILEGLDAQGRAVAPGEFSHTTLLTNLANRTQPLLRYILTDRVCFLEAPCPCGSAFPAIAVQGRADDVLSLPGAQGGSVTLLPLALETVLEEDAGVTRFQLVLRPDRVLELRLPAAEDDPQTAFKRCRLALQACFARHGAAPQRIVRSRQPPVQQAGSGKLRRVVDLQRGASHP